MAYAPFVDEGAYTLDSGDRLRIVVFGQEGLTNSYAVDASGHIAMPLIGSVLARGATTDQLSRRIADKLRQGYIREPHVAVEIEAYRPFFILGEVTQPGQYPYVANMTVETAVAIAGGFRAARLPPDRHRHPFRQRPAAAHDRAGQLSRASGRHGECAGAVVLTDDRRRTTDGGTISSSVVRHLTSTSARASAGTRSRAARRP
jgi:protein involved in polysaccharide export with SLBB domain